MLLHVVKAGATVYVVFRGLARMSCAFLLTRKTAAILRIHTASLAEQILAGVARRMRCLRTADSANYYGRCFMNDPEIEQRFHLMQKEIGATAALLKETKVDLTAAIGSLRIEIEILKTYMERYHPEFAKTYPRLREEAIQAIDPEWIGAEAD
jgi:hypothetical protein